MCSVRGRQQLLAAQHEALMQPAANTCTADTQSSISLSASPQYNSTATLDPTMGQQATCMPPGALLLRAFLTLSSCRLLDARRLVRRLDWYGNANLTSDLSMQT
jgi:hypothetical protein